MKQISKLVMAILLATTAVPAFADITGNFSGKNNDASGVGGWPYGGAINNSGDAGNITATFTSNSASADGNTGYAVGGALYNGDQASIDEIIAEFGTNGAMAGYALGGAFYNGSGSKVGNIQANFSGNYTSGRYSSGGAINNIGYINSVNGDFSDNYSQSTDLAENAQGYALGGAIYNKGFIGSLHGNFSNNSVTANSPLNSIIGAGGAIYNADDTSDIAELVGNFTNNYAGGGNGYGGAIYIGNGSLLSSITGDFVGNTAESIGTQFVHGIVAGGVIQPLAAGGAIFNNSTTELTVAGNFLNNSAADSGTGQSALGGAIYTRGILNLVSDGVAYRISGNVTNEPGKYAGAHNAIWMAGGNLNFNLTNGGSYTIDDTITGADASFNVNINGDGSDGARVVLNNTLETTQTITVNNATLAIGYGPYGNGQLGNVYDTTDNVLNNWNPFLALNDGTLDLHNGQKDNMYFDTFSSAGDSYMMIDVSPDALTADMLHGGAISGTTNVIIYADSRTNPQTLGDMWFADGTGAADAFKIYRVEGNAFMQTVDYATDETTGLNKWGWKYDPAAQNELTPEVNAYTGLHAAALELTRNLIPNVNNKLQMDQNSGRGDLHTHETMFQVWALPVYQNTSYKNPAKMDTNVWGAEIGADVRFDQRHTIGLFGSIRDSGTDLDASDKSPIESRIDLDSYAGGVYYRYDDDKFWGFVSAYAGGINGDINTADGVNADTKGTEMGLGAELGYVFNLTKYWTLSPSLAGEYLSLNMDDVSDDFGKTASYDTLGYAAAQFGLRIEHMWDNKDGIAKLYLKPAIVKTFTNGANANITGIGDVDTLDDMWLGQLEIGGRYTVSQVVDLSAYANYSIGDDYSGFGVGIGINLKF